MAPLSCAERARPLRSLTDDLIDLLIGTIHRIGARAERKVERELLNDIKRVGGKRNLLFELVRCHTGPAGRPGARGRLSGGRGGDLA